MSQRSAMFSYSGCNLGNSEILLQKYVFCYFSAELCVVVKSKKLALNQILAEVHGNGYKLKPSSCGSDKNPLDTGSGKNPSKAES